jgi:hypothetical protein
MTAEERLLNQMMGGDKSELNDAVARASMADDE